MGISGQPHALAALPWGKSNRYPLIWMFEGSHSLCGRCSNSQPCDHTNYSIPAPSTPITPCTSEGNNVNNFFITNLIHKLLVYLHIIH